MKRFAALFLAMILALSLLVGCGPKNNNQQNDGKTPDGDGDSQTSELSG